jgi:hypothetical protein
LLLEREEGQKARGEVKNEEEKENGKAMQRRVENGDGTANI